METLTNQKERLVGRMMVLWNNFDDLFLKLSELKSMKDDSSGEKIAETNRVMSQVKMVSEAMIRLETQYGLALEEERVGIIRKQNEKEN